MHSKNLSLLFLIVFILFGCEKKEEKTKKYEVRNVDLKITDDERDALNYLTVNMDPFLEEPSSPNEGDIACKVFFYFNITKKEKSIVVKREHYFDFDRAEGQLLYNELRRIEYCILPIDMLVPQNIVVEKETDETPFFLRYGYYPYQVVVSTLYNKPVKHVDVWYSTSKERNVNKVQSMQENTVSGFALDFKSDFNKASLFASYLKKLCTIKIR